MNTEVKLAIIRQFQESKRFAERVGCSEMDVSRVIHGRKKLDRAEQARWAQILNVKRERLFDTG